MLWKYTDSTGIERTGTVEKTVDRGGSDVTYFFRRSDGKLDVVSGFRLKQTNAHPIYSQEN
jgi:hypothetical protein